MLESILVALDGSATSNAGLNCALRFARDHRARLVGLHVIDDRGILINVQEGHLPAKYFDKLYATMRRRGQTILARAQTAARSAGVKMTPLLIDSRGQMVAHAILEQARATKSDMIVMGTHGRRGVARVLMGSDAEEVVHEATVPVLLVRSPRHPTSSHTRPQQADSTSANRRPALRHAKRAPSPAASRPAA
ncbi:MAG TPA: universal stress protein [Casimicrobiaceae bacterium]|nr:universal stress protein [Casimicrobiaceae bacterium]